MSCALHRRLQYPGIYSCTATRLSEELIRESSGPTKLKTSVASYEAQVTARQSTRRHMQQDLRLHTAPPRESQIQFYITQPRLWAADWVRGYDGCRITSTREYFTIQGISSFVSMSFSNLTSTLNF